MRGDIRAIIHNCDFVPHGIGNRTASVDGGLSFRDTRSGDACWKERAIIRLREWRIQRDDTQMGGTLYGQRGRSRADCIADSVSEHCEGGGRLRSLKTQCNRTAGLRHDTYIQPVVLEFSIVGKLCEAGLHGSMTRGVRAGRGCSG